MRDEDRCCVFEERCRVPESDAIEVSRGGNRRTNSTITLSVKLSHWFLSNSLKARGPWQNGWCRWSFRFKGRLRRVTAKYHVMHTFCQKDRRREKARSGSTDRTFETTLLPSTTSSTAQFLKLKASHITD